MSKKSKQARLAKHKGKPTQVKKGKPLYAVDYKGEPYRKKPSSMEIEDDILTGTMISTSRGFGFIKPSIEGEDVFVSESNLSGAWNGDEVQYSLLKAETGKRREAVVHSIISHASTQVVGIYEKHKNYGFVKADDTKITDDIYIHAGKDLDAVTGHKVVVEITSYSEDNKKPEGIIIRILGHVNEPGVDILSIVTNFNIPTEFTEKMLNQADCVSKPVSDADGIGRRDLREMMMVTIDGEDSKDLDDAVSLHYDGVNYHLGVHIADVTNYVQENSALDREALNRGTSVYLLDRVIPMLPVKLSNGICSLNEGEDRLALSCMMTINDRGDIIDHEIVEAIINVNHRMTYSVVAQLLTEDSVKEQIPSTIEDMDGLRTKYADVLPMLLDMKELSRIIRKKRTERGSIDFDLPETTMVLDSLGRPIDIKAYEHNVATKLIEDFMLSANETVAEEYFWSELPFLYRTHEAPDEDNISKLSSFLNGLGYHIRLGSGTDEASKVKSKEIQKLLGKIEGTSEEMMITRLTLRSMMQARYSPECKGHFGLAAKYYTHFTSPIRRYPDLQIHRIIKDKIRGRMSEARIEHYAQILPEVASQTSLAERRAEQCERDVTKLKKAEYMVSHIGEEYQGVISGVTKWGAYVELDNTIEGLVHVTNMTDDHYELMEDLHQLRGLRSGTTYMIGQKVRVRVVDVSTTHRTIDFEFCEENEE